MKTLVIILAFLFVGCEKEIESPSLTQEHYRLKADPRDNYIGDWQILDFCNTSVFMTIDKGANGCLVINRNNLYCPNNGGYELNNKGAFIIYQYGNLMYYYDDGSFICEGILVKA